MNPPNHEVFLQAARAVREWRKPVLLSHAKPDGDAIGSLVAMRGVLRSLGIEPLAVVFDDVPDRYQFLVNHDPLTMWDAVSTDARDAVDGIIMLDTCAFSQVEPIAEWLRSVKAPLLVVDHHVSRDDVSADYLVDESASATCVILLDWFRAADWTIDRTITEALFVGIATDTGWFRHSNTDARTLEAAGYLAASGARPNELFDSLFQSERESRFRLRAVAAGRLELFSNDRLALTTIPRAVFDECGAVPAETEDLVNEPLRIATVVLSAMLVEQEDSVVRVGLRSRAPLGSEFPDIDVASFARALGGGGHRRAAGVRMAGNLADVRATLLSKLGRLLEP